jgi:hypothetical protein
MNMTDGQTATETTSIPGALPQATLNIAFGEKRRTNHLEKERNGQPFRSMDVSIDAFGQRP